MTHFAACVQVEQHARRDTLTASFTHADAMNFCVHRRTPVPMPDEVPATTPAAPGRVLPGQPAEEPIPPEMPSPEKEPPVQPSPGPESP